MATVAPSAHKGEENTDHRAGVIKTALSTTGGSGFAIIGILTASAFGAVPMPLAVVALAIFGVIMLAALVVAGIYINRRE